MINFVDIALFAIVALIVLISAKSGFFKTLFDLVAYVVAVVFARSFSSVLAQSAFDSFIRDGAQHYLDTSLGGIGSTDYIQQAQQVIESIPEGFRGLMQILGYNEEVLIEQINSSDLGGSNLSETLMNSVVEPVGVAIMQFVLFVILAIAFFIAAKLIVVLLNKIIKKMPVIKKMNTVLGGVLGLVKGCIIIAVVSSALSLVASVSDNSTFINTVDGSVFVSLVNSIIAGFSL